LSRTTTHSRDSSLDKLALPPSQPHSASSSIASPRLPGSQRAGLALGVFERLIEPKNSSLATYGHHRQTSIVHGIQHSRNGSVASSSSSPLSPEIIAAAGVGHVAEMAPLSRTETDARSLASLSGTTISSNPHGPIERGTLPQLPEMGLGYGPIPRKPDRMLSRPRRDQSRNQSHSSRHHKDEKETVADYALHVLFTSVSCCADLCFPTAYIS